MEKEIVLGQTLLLIIMVVFGGCIEGNISPTADFTTSIINTGSADVRGVQFSDNSSDPDGEIIAWHWEFGDGKTSTQQNPKHNYSGIPSEVRSSGGYYTIQGYDTEGEPILEGPFFNVTLTVTDNQNATNSVTKTVYAEAYLPVVHRELIANFTYTPHKNITSQTIIEFNASSSIAALVDQEGNINNILDKNMSYHWDFGDETNITKLNATTTHQYDTAGLYTVNLTIVDEDGYSGYVMKNVTIE